MNNKIRILSRKSDLAVIQAKLVGDLLKKQDPNIQIEYYKKSTTGDNDLKTSLSEMEKSGVFTDDLRQELIKNKCDLVVHSWKDLPIEIDPNTEIAGTLRRADQRDILFVKKDHISKIFKSKRINVFSSSPRRIYNLKTFIPDFLPFHCDEILFHNIRGNITTRFKKFLESNQDAFIVAKAAIDRLIQNQYNEFSDLATQIKEYINQCAWTIIPLSQNPTSPGQGALGLEIRKNDKFLKSNIDSITEPIDLNCVKHERKILKQYGGGCHQNIGVSFFPTFFGIMKSEKGETKDGKKFNDWKWFNRNISTKNIINNYDIFPNNLNDYDFFEREEIPESINYINSLEKHCIWISRKSALPFNSKISNSNIVWTSGIKTWKSLAKKGIWVNGTSDGMGEDMNPNIKSINNYPWIKLTHSLSPESAIKNKIITYKLIKKKINHNLKDKKYFYWMSFSAFKYALEKNPSIIFANHSCGPGNTYNEIKKIIKDSSKLEIFLSYEEWKENFNIKN